VVLEGVLVVITGPLAVPVIDEPRR
jgi:hypothetical protein